MGLFPKGLPVIALAQARQAGDISKRVSLLEESWLKAFNNEFPNFWSIAAAHDHGDINSACHCYIGPVSSFDTLALKYVQKRRIVKRFMAGCPR